MDLIFIFKKISDETKIEDEEYNSIISELKVLQIPASKNNLSKKELSLYVKEHMKFCDEC